MLATTRRGLLLLRAGLYSNVIRTLVPLTIDDAQLGEGLDILEASLADRIKSGGGPG